MYLIELLNRYAPNGHPIGDKDGVFSGQKSKYDVRTRLGQNAHTMLSISKVSLDTSGAYRCVVKTGNLTREEVLHLTVKSPPIVTAAVVGKLDFYAKAHEYRIKCSARGFPVPRVDVIFKPCRSFDDCSTVKSRTLGAVISRRDFAHAQEIELFHVAGSSGQLICQACNDVDGRSICRTDILPFVVSEVGPEGFAVYGPDEVNEGSAVKLTCAASSFNYTDVKWYKYVMGGARELSDLTAKNEDKGIYTVTKTLSNWTVGKVLRFPNVTMSEKGNYFCRAQPRDDDNSGKMEEQVRGRKSPLIMANRYINDDSFTGKDPGKNRGWPVKHLMLLINPNEPPEWISGATNLNDSRSIVEDAEDGITLKCAAVGNPEPKVFWTLNEHPLNETTRKDSLVSTRDRGRVLKIHYLTSDLEGRYSCLANNSVGAKRLSQVVELRSTVVGRDVWFERISYPVIAAVVVAVVFVCVLLVSAKLCYARNRKRKRRSREGSWKPATSSTTASPAASSPRLRQYELPGESHLMMTSSHSDDLEGDHHTLASRDGSISPYGVMRYSSMRHNNHHQHQPQPPHCHCHYSGCPSQMSTLLRETPPLFALVEMLHLRLQRPNAPA